MLILAYLEKNFEITCRKNKRTRLELVFFDDLLLCSVY